MQQPVEIGVRPSTSLPGAISSVSFGPSMCCGVGSCSRMPLTAGSALSCVQQRADLGFRVSAARRWSKPWMPASAHAFCLPLT